MRVPLARVLFYLCFFVGWFGAAKAMAEDRLSATAKQHFDAGIAYVDDPAGPKYEEAYEEFKIAYEDSHNYLILANVGICAFYLERDGEAIAAYEGYLAKAKPKDISDKKRVMMETDVSTLKASLVRMTYRTTPTTVAITDERIPAKGLPITNRYHVTDGVLNLGIHPGQHRITASAEGYLPQTWEVDARSASTHTHEFVLKRVAEEPSAHSSGAPPETAKPPAKQEPDPSKLTAPPETTRKRSMTPVYIGVAATGVFAIGATVTGLMVQSKKSEFEDVNRDGTQPDKARSIKDDGKLYALLTDVGIGAAVLSAGVTAYLYFSQPSMKTEQRTPTAKCRLEPTVGQKSAGLLLSGKF